MLTLEDEDEACELACARSRERRFCFFADFDLEDFDEKIPLRLR